MELVVLRLRGNSVPEQNPPEPAGTRRNLPDLFLNSYRALRP